MPDANSPDSRRRVPVGDRLRAVPLGRRLARLLGRRHAASGGAALAHQVGAHRAGASSHLRRARRGDRAAGRRAARARPGARRPCPVPDGHGHRDRDRALRLLQGRPRARVHAAAASRDRDGRARPTLRGDRLLRPGGFQRVRSQRLRRQAGAADVATVREIIVARGAAPSGTRGFEALIESVSLAQARARLAGVTVGTEDVLTFQLSGGTTGVPKIIPRFHAEYMGSARDWARRQLMDETRGPALRAAAHPQRRADREPLPRAGDGRHDRAHAAHGPQGVLRVGRAGARDALDEHRSRPGPDARLRRRVPPRPLLGHAADELQPLRSAGAAPERALREPVRHHRGRADGVRARRSAGGSPSDGRPSGVGSRRDPPAGAGHRARGAVRGAGRALLSRALDDPRVFPHAGRQPHQLHRRRLLPDRRHHARSAPRRSRVLLVRGPDQGQHRPRRREVRRRGSREPDRPASPRRRREGGGHARSGLRREGLRLPDHAPGPRAAHGAGDRRLPDLARARQVQAARARRGHRRFSADPGRQGRQGRAPPADRRQAGRGAAPRAAEACASA